MNLNPKTEAIFALVLQGKSIEDAWNILKPDKELTASNKHYLKKKLETYQIVTPKSVKLANKALINTLQGKQIGDARPPNHSDVIKASEVVLDRAYPKINVNENRNLNVSLAPVNLDKYKVVDNLAVSYEEPVDNGG